jgi:hypothetical protein
MGCRQRAGTLIMSFSSAARFWPVIFSGRCIGHLVSRGAAGVEAFNQADSSIGTFTSLAEAADALKPRGAP